MRVKTSVVSSRRKQRVKGTLSWGEGGREGGGKEGGREGGREKGREGGREVVGARKTRGETWLRKKQENYHIGKEEGNQAEKRERGKEAENEGGKEGGKEGDTCTARSRRSSKSMPPTRSRQSHK
jgi:hypothetical protein